MSEEERAATPLHIDPVKPTSVHTTDDDDDGGDEPVPSLDNVSGGDD